MKCEFCGHGMTESHVGSFWCERCGASKPGGANGPTLPGSRPLAECLARWEAEHNPTPEQLAQQGAAEEHARRWAKATNDPNGNY